MDLSPTPQGPNPRSAPRAAAEGPPGAHGGGGGVRVRLVRLSAKKIRHLSSKAASVINKQLENRAPVAGARLAATGKNTNKQRMHVRTFFMAAGRCFVVRRSHFARTPFKHALAAPLRLRAFFLSIFVWFKFPKWIFFNCF